MAARPAPRRRRPRPCRPSVPAALRRAALGALHPRDGQQARPPDGERRPAAARHIRRSRCSEGRAEVDRGEVWFEGRRYVVSRGTVDFPNPSKIEPYFDVEAETRVRAPGQTYQVTLRASGILGAVRVGPVVGPAAAPGRHSRAAARRDAVDPGRRVARAADAGRRGAEPGASSSARLLAGRNLHQRRQGRRTDVRLDTVQITPFFVDPTSSRRGSRRAPA